MKKHIEDMIAEFNYEVLNIPARPPGLQEKAEFELSTMQLREEIDELEAAYSEKDLVGCVDAVCDLVYFSFGVLIKLGVDPDSANQIMSIIHSANMAKKKGQKETRIVDGNPADAIKPRGWVPPEAKIRLLLEGIKNDFS